MGSLMYAQFSFTSYVFPIFCDIDDRPVKVALMGLKIDLVERSFQLLFSRNRTIRRLKKFQGIKAKTLDGKGEKKINVK